MGFINKPAGWGTEDRECNEANVCVTSLILSGKATSRFLALRGENRSRRYAAINRSWRYEHL
jgi:hypothetical protein